MFCSVVEDKNFRQLAYAYTTSMPVVALF